MYTTRSLLVTYTMHILGTCARSLMSYYGLDLNSPNKDIGQQDRWGKQLKESDSKSSKMRNLNIPPSITLWDIAHLPNYV